jgi:riboflavin biosynthesis pyrimidine reductase
LKPLARLFERTDLPVFGLPASLAERYAGDFGFQRPGMYANFVTSVDGVAALPGPGEAGAVVSGGDEPDRFIMGLLRACADAVVVGAGTFRKAGRSLWHPESVYPAAREGYAELRLKLGLSPQPLLVVVTASGELDASQPALRDSLVLTTAEGERRLRGRLPSGSKALVLDGDRIGGQALVACLHDRGLQSLLLEGGPTLAGQLIREGLVQQLFLTTSPRLFGRAAGDGRKALVEGVDLGGKPLGLLSVRAHESHLYLRYAL